MDRNQNCCPYLSSLTRSLSARREWIEMVFVTLSRFGIMSLSARRAWIEIQISVSTVVGVLVALRKESVDRNACIGFH